MRHLLRLLCLACLGVFLVGIVAPGLLKTGISGDTPRTEVPASAAGVVNPVPEAPLAIKPSRAPGERDSQSYRTPLVRTLADAVDQADGDLGESKDEIHRQLRAADEELWRVKQANREAVRQVNRQVRVQSATAPHVIVVVCAGLNREDLHCYNPEAPNTPAFDQLALQGSRATNFAVPQQPLQTTYEELFYGIDLRENRPRPSMSLAETLWQAGYATGIFGDLSGIDWSQPPHGFDRWVGFPTTENATDAFPKTVILNGKRTTVKEQPSGGLRRADELFLLDGSEFRRLAGAHRPTAAFIMLQVDWSAADGDVPAQRRSHAEGVEQLDLALANLLKRLEGFRSAQNTLVLVTGIPQAAIESNPLGEDDRPLHAAPLLVRWPSGIPAGGLIPQPSQWRDLAPTLMELVHAHLRPRGLPGISQAEAWKAAEPAVINQAVTPERSTSLVEPKTKTAKPNPPRRIEIIRGVAR